MEYLDQLFAQIVPPATTVAVWLGAAAIGFIGAALSMAANSYIAQIGTNGKVPVFSWQVFRGKVLYCLFGACCAVIGQMIQASEKVLFLQALTIGAAWPSFAQKFRKQQDLVHFLAGGKDVPVEAKDD